VKALFVWINVVMRNGDNFATVIKFKCVNCDVVLEVSINWRADFICLPEILSKRIEKRTFLMLVFIEENSIK